MARLGDIETGDWAVKCTSSQSECIEYSLDRMERLMTATESVHEEECYYVLDALGSIG